MKISWVNNNKEFELPTIKVSMELEILGYLDKNTKDCTSHQKNILEFVETVYYVLNSIDKNVTREMIKDKLSLSELGELFTVFRTNGMLKYVCPHCKKSFTQSEMKTTVEGDKNFHNTTPKSSTVIKDGV